MRWPVEMRGLLPRLVWICLVLAVAAYGGVVVRNVTDTLIGIADHSRAVVVAERPVR
jgi:hypothetical protein